MSRFGGIFSVSDTFGLLNDQFVTNPFCLRHILTDIIWIQQNRNSRRRFELDLVFSVLGQVKVDKTWIELVWKYFWRQYTFSKFNDP